MNLANPFLLLFVGLFVVVAGYLFMTHYFSADAKRERRRRRSNARIVSGAKRPTVKFSVRTPKEED